MKKILYLLLCAGLFISCDNAPAQQEEDPAVNKVWAWVSGSLKMSEEKLEHYFAIADSVGIDAIIMECHSGYPVVLDSTTFVDSAAIKIIERAVPYAQKYGIELHAWMWTTNRCEKHLREAHPDWYQVNAQGESCNDIKLYGREHYRWLCPSRSEVTEYLKERATELARIDGLAGVHLDFIRYPDVILPYALHESRGVVQDKVYPLWDFCYCDSCRAAFKELHGIDPMELEDPTACEEWMQYRWDVLAKQASDVCEAIKAEGKMATAAVFASPEESKKLVRQDWANFKNIDVILPMIYHKYYGWEDEMVATATTQGVEALAAAGSPAYLCSGLFVGHMPEGKIYEFMDMTRKAGSKGFCFFSMEGLDRKRGGGNRWDEVAEAIKMYKEGVQEEQVVE